jgi:hypothetical protein
VNFISLSLSLSMVLRPFGSWPLIRLLSSFTQTVGLLGRGISPPQGRYLHTEQHKHRKTHTDIHTLSLIQTHDLSVRADEDGSCLRRRGHCVRLNFISPNVKIGEPRGESILELPNIVTTLFCNFSHRTDVREESIAVLQEGKRPKIGSLTSCLCSVSSMSLLKALTSESTCMSGSNLYFP